jgi:pilus assembly protein CpaC
MSLKSVHSGVAMMAVALALGAGAPTATAKPVKHGKTTTRTTVRVDVAVHRGEKPMLTAGVDRPSREVYLSIGEGELITLPAAAGSVWVSNPAAADVYVNGARQIHLYGKAFGETTVFVTTTGGAVLYAAHVIVSQNSTSVDRMLHAAMPEADIKITLEGQIAILTGTVASPKDSEEAERLVRMILNPGSKNADDVKIAVISRLRTSVPQQVSLRVRIAEVSRTLVKNIGVNLQTIDGTGGIKFGVGTGRSIATTVTTNPKLPFGVGLSSVQGYATDPVTGALTQMAGTAVNQLSGSNTIGLMGKLFGLNILGALDAGETAGLVTTLAEPNLVAMSGETAEFLAGGEYPIPMSSGLGTVSVEYKKYGVSLSYTPTVLADGRISLRVRPEVSELSTEGAVTVSGYSIPALTVRSAETSIELGSGQSFMIAGLMRNGAQNSTSKLPGAGDVPILGSLFRSNAFQRGDTELVIVVTPYLVKPVDDKDIKLPTDGYQTQDDVQRLFGNMQSNGQSGLQRPKPTTAPEAPAPAAKIGAADTGASNAAAAKTGASAKPAAGTAPGFNLN